MVGGKFAPASIDALKAENVLVVGKIQLLPALREGEQRLASTATTAFKDKALLITGDKKRSFKDVDGFSMRHLAQVDLDKTFYYQDDSASQLIFSGGYIQLEMFGDRTDQKLYLPGGLAYRIKPGQKAVYIGTLVYYRDDYNKIIRMQVKNEYKEANKDFKKLYGNSVRLYPLEYRTLKN